MSNGKRGVKLFQQTHSSSSSLLSKCVRRHALQRFCARCILQRCIAQSQNRKDNDSIHCECEGIKILYRVSPKTIQKSFVHVIIDFFSEFYAHLLPENIISACTLLRNGINEIINAMLKIVQKFYINLLITLPLFYL